MLRRFVPLFLLIGCAPLACSSADDPATPPADSSITEVGDETGDTGAAEVEVDAFEAAVDSGAIDSSVDTAVDETTSDASSDVADAPKEASADAGETGSDASTSCKTGSVQEEACGKCGTRSRLCDASKWLEWSGCFGETGTCVPGDKRSVACGRCGTRSQTCNATCSWDSDACTGEGTCVPGSTETAYTCLDSAKAKTRTCSDSCAWSTWSDCK